MEFRNIYETKNKACANKLFLVWIEKIFSSEMKLFYSVANSVKYHFNGILNFFNNRNTNANAESFNSKIKLFRANLRGVTDTSFFLFRLHKLFT
jgi:transposase